MPHFKRIRLLVLALLAALLSAEAGQAQMQAPATAAIAPGVELAAETGVSRVWLPSYAGADMLHAGNFSPTSGHTKTDFSGSIPLNAFALGLNVDTPLSLPGFSSISLKGRVQYAEGEQRTSEYQTTNQYMVAMSLNPRYNYTQILGTNVLTTFAESVRFNLENIDLSLGFEGKGTAQALSGSVSMTPMAYAGLLLQNQETRIRTKIVRLVSGTYDSLDERLSSLLLGPELRAGVQFALPWQTSVEFMANFAWQYGTCSLSASQYVYSNEPVVNVTQSPVPYTSRRLDRTYDTFTYGASLKVEKQVVDSLRLGLNAFGTYWSNVPGIKNPIESRTTPASASYINPGVLIKYNDALELGLKLKLDYTF